MRCVLRALCLAPVLLAAHLAAAVELAQCFLSANEGRSQAVAQCGVVAVPLNPQDPDGERIELRIAVVEALAEDPAPDPLFVIAGGPGQAATDFFALTERAFRRILRYRSVVLVDQRGTGESAPLNCPSLEEMEPSAGVREGEPLASKEPSSGEREGLAPRKKEPSAGVREGLAPRKKEAGGESSPQALAAKAIDCLHELKHDPRFFTTSVAVGDLDIVRAALGYETLNLYGISYGTRVAQHYLRRFPERVRSVVLDGVLPTTVSLGPDLALDSQAALDRVFERCQADDACSAAFPNLREQLGAVLARLREQPAQTTFAHPRTGERTEADVDHLTMAGVVRLLVYSPITASLLPPLIEAVHDGDYAKLAAQAYAVNETMRDLAVGLNYAVLCTEDHPFWGEIDDAAQRATYMGATLVETTRLVCDTWPAGAIDADFKAPLASETPVLLLSGELDPITPPRYAETAAAQFPNALNLVGAGQGHGMMMVPCMQGIVGDFLELAPSASDVAAIDLSCLERLRPFPLFVSPLGPGP